MQAKKKNIILFYLAENQANGHYSYPDKLELKILRIAKPLTMPKHRFLGIRTFTLH